MVCHCCRRTHRADYTPSPLLLSWIHVTLIDDSVSENPVTIWIPRVESLIFRCIRRRTPPWKSDCNANPLCTVSLSDSLGPSSVLRKACGRSGRICQKVFCAELVNCGVCCVSIEEIGTCTIGVGIARIGGTNESFAGCGYDGVCRALIGHCSAGFESEAVRIATIDDLA